MIRSLAAAAMLLTRVPMPASVGTADPAGTAIFYPVIGALTGAGLGLVVTGGLQVWPVLLVAVLTVVVEVVLTGALHLDGLADCADAAGGRTRPQRLQIMKDHSVGVYGASAVALTLLLKVALVVTLATVLTGTELVLLLAAAYALSRGAMLPLARALPYARAEGTGRAVIEGLRTRQVVVGLALSAVLLVPALWAGAMPVLSMVVATVIMTTIIGWAAKRVLGGVTGDVLGSCAELTLVTALLGAAAVLS